MTCVEESVIAKHHVKVQIYKINTGRSKWLSQSKMKGNVITFPQKPETLLLRLPSMPKAELFQVAFIGANRPDPKSIKNIYRVRKANIRSALSTLKKNNKNYSDVEIDNETIEQLPIDDIPTNILEEFIYVDKEDDETHKVGYDNLNRETDENDMSDETICFTSSLLNNTAESMSHDLLEQLNFLKNGYQKANGGSFDSSWYMKMTHDTEPISEINNPDHLINAYPTLFPLGIGGIGDCRRKIKLTYREHVNYLLHLNSDRFRCHRSFLYVVIIYFYYSKFSRGFLSTRHLID